MKKFVIVGSGRQGVAVAYDLLRDRNHNVTIVDIDQKSIDNAIKKLEKIIDISNLTFIKESVINEQKMEEILLDANVLISAVPYEFNLKLTEIAINPKTSMVDLRHTNIVRKQLSMNEKAKQSQITIVPDCGIGPDMNVTMAVLATELLDQTLEIRI